jgi:hypothetical protein
VLEAEGEAKLEAMAAAHAAAVSAHESVLCTMREEHCDACAALELDWESKLAASEAVLETRVITASMACQDFEASVGVPDGVWLQQIATLQSESAVARKLVDAMQVCARVCLFRW